MSVVDLLISSFPLLLKGALTTVWISILGIVFALIVGLIVAMLTLPGIKVLDWLTNLYVSFFRGTPLLVQLFIIYFGFASIVRFTPFQSIVIGLTLHFGAYISESFRGAIASISKEQWEAAFSLGFNKFATFRYIIFPQAWRRAVPSVWNSLIDVVKASSLASVVTVEELTSIADQISSASAVVLPILLEAAAIYWLLTTLLSVLQQFFERRYKYVNS
ncbi:amino acid ABC transporter permease [Leptolyngbya sp. FACHB-261]|uniref:amino acid ABC transporter permease n=1 Tax=Leptolyngbya sp. FACHB-261 TaxID=2692806 RepID=UPI001683CA24|nr:amino acid ABC transporter permease [Leptolyngbya sp. FACHB-261]MBD2104479.1 amino acid ABC transporter permease [Leptolyngbya sp. FACHB-261]